MVERLFSSGTYVVFGSPPVTRIHPMTAAFAFVEVRSGLFDRFGECVVVRLLPGGGFSRDPVVTGQCRITSTRAMVPADRVKNDRES
jgi:hypothetical protein